MNAKTNSLNWLACLTLAWLANAADPDVYAKRKPNRLDTNGNGTFGKQEDPRQWNRLSKLDRNRDNVLTLEELTKEETRYLETSGEKKLNIVYEQVGTKVLHLDLYYPTENHRCEVPTDCLHAWRRLAASKVQRPAPSAPASPSCSTKDAVSHLLTTGSIAKLSRHGDLV